MRRTYRRSGGLAVLVAAAAIGLVACGGSTNSAHVASLGNSGSDPSGNSTTSGSSTTNLPKGNPAQLLDEWAACMRSRGDRGQADPTITASKVIEVVWNPATPGGLYGTNKGGQGNSGPGQFCRAYLTAAQMALRVGQPPPKVDLATLLKFSECMRANGIANFPDPSANGLSFSVNAGSDLSPSNPTFQNASKVCAKKTGAKVPGNGPPPPGTIAIDGSGPAGTNG